MDSTIDRSTQLQSAKHKAIQDHELGELQSSKVEAPAVSQSTEILRRKFTLFNRLPQETKDAIWEYAVRSADSHVVQIGSDFTSKSPIPGVLHPCHNSRQHALKRWKLSFGETSQPAKIFFDFETDMLYFCPRFHDMHEFIAVCNKVDRLALTRIAFRPLELYDMEFYETGLGLAHRLHRYFPKLNEVVFVEKDVKYDWARHDVGKNQRRRNSMRTVITFSPPTRQIDETVRSEVLKCYQRKRWACPDVKYMDYELSFPHALGYDASEEVPTDEDDENFFIRDLTWTGDDNSDYDDDGLPMGGWLEELPDLQTLRGSQPVLCVAR